MQTLLCYALGETPASFQTIRHSESRMSAAVRMQNTDGNVCVQGTVTYGDGSTQVIDPALWRVTSTNVPAIEFVIRGDPSSDTIFRAASFVSIGSVTFASPSLWTSAHSRQERARGAPARPHLGTRAKPAC